MCAGHQSAGWWPIIIFVAKENKMEAYTRFAEVYDTFMDNVPYEEWAD